MPWDCNPEERNVVSYIIIGAFRFAAQFGMNFSDQLHLAFRIKSGDEYIPIEFTAGIYELDMGKSIKSCYLIIRNNPFPRNVGCIEFAWKSQFTDGEKFRDFMQLHQCNELSIREFEVLEFVAKGFKNDYISKTLFI